MVYTNLNNLVFFCFIPLGACYLRFAVLRFAGFRFSLAVLRLADETFL